MKAISSELQEASASIFAKPCWYLGGTLVGDAGDDAVLTVYNNASAASGTAIDYFQCSDQTLNVSHLLQKSIWCSNGIYAEISETEKVADGSCIVWYAL